MSYRYDALEEALELAASKLPLNIFGLLVSQVEDIITTRADGDLLERKIHNMVAEYTNQAPKPAFTLDRLEEAEALAS